MFFYGMHDYKNNKTKKKDGEEEEEEAWKTYDFSTPY